ncbi:MAG: crossover junction endodeoxyribonuclease RuvC [Planctomycetaceae bacterium]|nr:crossover junction endodeoxyribonuclease RuvC [Planctomycetaceae bacterium]
MSIILGVDPGLNITGYGVIEVTTGMPRRVRLLEAGIVRSKSKELSKKIEEIFDGVTDVIGTFSPKVLALEEVYSHYKRPMTAVLMGHARGCICLAAAKSDIRVVSYAATKVKKLLTGNGRAGKEQIQRAIRLELNLDREPDPPDVADALAIALCHAYRSSLD